MTVEERVEAFLRESLELAKAKGLKPSRGVFLQGDRCCVLGAVLLRRGGEFPWGFNLAQEASQLVREEMKMTWEDFNADHAVAIITGWDCRWNGFAPSSGFGIVGARLSREYVDP